VALRVIKIKGPKGSLQREVVSGIEIKLENKELSIIPVSEEKEISRIHGLYWSLVNNMVQGVASGFTKRLEMIGVGYRASVQGKALDLQIGLSHPTQIPIPEGIQVAVEKNTLISISGVDKQRVGQFAADIRSKKPPEPYKGKGIRYVNEFVRKKAGKAGKAGKK
jgi:large subunit ribosomal protein L6